MRNTILSIILVMLVVCSSSRSSAVVVFRKGSDTPIMGLLMSQDERRVVVRELLAGDKYRDHVLLRSEIEELLLTVSPERLSTLTADAPQAYRNYAEELAEKRRDPEARQTAIRLYLIAAYLDPQELGRGCLLGMIDLARSPGEERQFRAMAYLLDREHDRRVLRTVAAIRVETTDDQGRSELLRTLRMLRQGNRVAVRRMLLHPSVQKQLEAFQAVVTLSQLRLAAGLDVLPPDTLRKILILELALSGDAADDVVPTARVGSTAPWRETTRNDGLAPLPALTLETLTEFDPRKNRYRDGQWVADDR